MKAEKVSVVIPSYNAEKYIAEAIESALQQDHAPSEIIVVDDGSDDSTVAVASHYPVRLIALSRNRGHAYARNVGLQAASEYWIAWLDADDRWEPDHLSTLLQVANASPTASIVASAWRFIGSRRDLGRPTIPEGYTRPFLLTAFRGTPFFASAVLTAKSALEDVGGFNVGLYHAPDFDIWLRLSLTHGAAATYKITSCYRWHEGQISFKGWPSQLKSMYAARDLFILNLEQRGYTTLAHSLKWYLDGVWLWDLWWTLHLENRDALKILLVLGQKHSCVTSKGLITLLFALILPPRYWSRLANRVKCWSQARLRQSEDNVLRVYEQTQL